MIPKQSRDGSPVRQGYGVIPGAADTYISYGEGWGNVSNTPFREYKHRVHEGGISTPLIVHWPAGIPATQKNKLIQTPGHLIDIMATCVDVAGESSAVAVEKKGKPRKYRHADYGWRANGMLMCRGGSVPSLRGTCRL